MLVGDSRCRDLDRLRESERNTIAPKIESFDDCSFPDAEVRTLAQMAMVAMNRGKCWKAMELLARRPWGLRALRLMIDARPGIISAREVRTRWMLLHYAASHRLGFVVALLEAGADPNARGTPDTPDTNRTPLFYATKNRKHGASVVSCLLEHGADPNAKNAEGQTALVYAAHYNNVAICKLLIAAGSDVNAEYDEGLTALEFAVEHTAPECIETLLAAGAKVNHHVAEAAMRGGSPRGLHLLFRAEPCCVHWAFGCIRTYVREEVLCINDAYLNRIRKFAADAQFVRLDAITADDHFTSSVDALISNPPYGFAKDCARCGKLVFKGACEFAAYEAYERDQRRALANIVRRHVVGHRVPAEIGDIIVEFWGHPGGYVVF